MTTTKARLIFVHGAWHGAWCWEKYFIPYFTSLGFDCHAFNLPKHDTPGPVTGINSLSLADYVQALKLEVDSSEELPIIIGHSMGGIIVQKYLETYPAKMAILLAPAPPAGVLTTTFRFLKKGYAYPALLLFDLYKLVNTPDKAKWAFFSDDFSKEETLEYSQKLCSESYLAFLNMLAPRVKLNYHRKIPMLLLAAENDRIFSVAEHTATAKKYGAELEVIPDIAHDLMLDKGREKVMGFMAQWIEKKEKEPLVS
ncbi:MAG: alpha/beta hydrolase [Bacteroidota bacterium]